MEEDRNLPVVEEAQEEEGQDKNLPMEIEGTKMGAKDTPQQPKRQQTETNGTASSQKAAAPAKSPIRFGGKYIYVLIAIAALAIVLYFGVAANLIPAISTTSTTTSTSSTTTSTTTTTTINPFNPGTQAHYLAANRGHLGLAQLSEYLNSNVSGIGLINASYNSSLTVSTGGNFTNTIRIGYRISKYYANISMAINRSAYLETDLRNQAGTYICIAQGAGGYSCSASAQTDVLNESFNPLSGIFRTGNRSILMQGYLSNVSVVSDSARYLGQNCTLFSARINATSHLDTSEVGNITNKFGGSITECISNSEHIPLFSSLDGNVVTIAKLSTGDTPQGIISVSLNSNIIYLNSKASASAASQLPGKLIG